MRTPPRDAQSPGGWLDESPAGPHHRRRSDPRHAGVLMPAATFHYRAVGADAKIRTGIITAESASSVSRELLRQGLTPVYVGANQKKGFEIGLPSFGSGRRRDVLFFTQELSTLLNSGVPLDRALSITSELTTRQQFRTIVLDILRSIKG